jgi:hypothetical protein
VIAAPLSLARGYQDRRVAAEIERRLEAARQPLQLAMRESKEHTALDVTNLPGQEDAARMPGTTRAEYLVARLGGRRCESASVPLRLQYDEPLDEREGFSRTMAVGIPIDETRFTTILVPVFFRVGGGETVRFRGFEVPRGDETCVELSRIVDPGQFEMLFTATLSPQWRARPLHQTISAIEPGFLGHEPEFVAMPQDLHLPRRLLTAPLAEADTIIRANTVRRTSAGTWTMNADAEMPFGGLLYFEPVQLRADGRFIVQGFLRSGGLLVEVVQDAEGRPRPRPEALNDRLLVQAKVTEPGPFVVVLATAAAGPGCLVVANHLPRTSLKNDFEISRAGWLVP